MSNLIQSFKKSIVEDILNSIESNNSNYYVCGCFSNTTIASDDYTKAHLPAWSLMFGKKLANTNIYPVIKNITWTSNTVYDFYNNEIDISNSNFYVVTEPDLVGGYYHVYKCLDNAGGARSTQKPDIQQLTSFKKSDGYIWRYMYSISYNTYLKFSTSEFIPVTPNSSVVSTSENRTGVENVIIANNGSGYNSYHDGIVRSVANTTTIQIDSTASIDIDFYRNNGIYIYSNNASLAQLNVVKNSFSNLSGNWVTLESPANTTNITAGVTQYKISPRVKFDSDGSAIPKAYTTINSVSNSINSIVIIDNGVGVTRASATIVSNTIFGSGAILKCVAPPAGGHGADPASELNIKGMSISFTFSGSESNSIPIGVKYNSINIIKDPYAIQNTGAKGTLYTGQSFSQLLNLNISPSVTFTVGDVIYGNTSGAKGIVVSSNSTNISLVGDRHFTVGETINGNSASSTISLINTLGTLYQKSIYPIYSQNIDEITRANTQAESYRIVIQI